MQPTFLPWLGYFAMIDAVDQFVFLDDVQHSRQSWQSRNHIKGRQGALMVILPVARKPSRATIAEAVLSSTADTGKLLATIRNDLGKAPYYDTVAPVLENALEHRRLADLNIALISGICAVTGIDTPLSRSSEMNVRTAERSARLLAISRLMKADVYLSPQGSFDYLDRDNPFESELEELAFFDYEHPKYPQLYGDFLPFMAAIDALANVGPECFAELASGGVKRNLTIADMQKARTR